MCGIIWNWSSTTTTTTFNFNLQKYFCVELLWQILCGQYAFSYGINLYNSQNFVCIKWSGGSALSSIAQTEDIRFYCRYCLPINSEIQLADYSVVSIDHVILESLLNIASSFSSNLNEIAWCVTITVGRELRCLLWSGSTWIRNHKQNKIRYMCIDIGKGGLAMQSGHCKVSLLFFSALHHLTCRNQYLGQSQIHLFCTFLKEAAIKRECVQHFHVIYRIQYYLLKRFVG